MFITFIAPVQASQDARGGEPMLAHVVLAASHNYTRNIKDFVHCWIFRVCITCLKETGYYVLDFEINNSTKYFLNKVVSKRSLSNH